MVLDETLLVEQSLTLRHILQEILKMMTNRWHGSLLRYASLVSANSLKFPVQQVNCNSNPPLTFL